MFKKLLSSILAQRQVDRKAQLRHNFIRHEARIGGEVFGPIPAGHRREFFCLDKNTWVWHEEWVDAHHQRQVVTTRYDVRPGNILKSHNGSHYQQVSPEETLRLKQAAYAYFHRVRREVYSFV